MFKSLANATKVLFFILLISSCGVQKPTIDVQKDPRYAGYLFAYFASNAPGGEQVRYAISTNGTHFFALNDGKPVLRSEEISASGGVRDPHILRGEDGQFYMVLTDLYVPEMGWENTAMVLLKSSDLIHWTHTVVDIPQTFPGHFGDVKRVWAPQTIYDRESGKYMLYWSMLKPGGRDIIYYAYANDDFTGLEAEPKQLLYKDGACIDGDIVFKDGQYHFFFKNEDDGAKGIMKAVSDKINEGYVVQKGYVDQTVDDVEGSGTFQLINSQDYVLMYDVYRTGKYQFCRTSDFRNFTVIDEDIVMNFHPRHGSAIPITEMEMDALLDKWGSLKTAVIGSENPAVKKINIVFEDDKIYLPVKPGTDLSAFDPQLMVMPGISVSPSGAQDFSKGAVVYTLSRKDQSFEILVTVSVDGNPVVEGYYADPEIIFSERDQKYYLYPTSDGFHEWSGTYFEAFSSPDLITWKNEGKILDLPTDVSWANHNAWAPAAIEVKRGDTYKYYYYFCGKGQIGAAVSDNPNGPFVDSGKPIVPDLDGMSEIDPDVFQDPKTGKYYLYWGNGKMVVAELNEDMVSINPATIKILTPDATFREGTEVFFYQGKYYFMWSENDTRDEDYRVRYATSDSPTGPLNIPENNLILAKDPTKAIYGTGHHSVIYSKEKDQWYIVYHRFNRPKGISIGRRAGYHRETCIDPMYFREDGSIIPVVPSLSGPLTPLAK